MTEPDGFGSRMRNRRVELGWSLTGLAARLRMSVSQASKYESGGRVPRPDIASRIAQVLNVNLEWLLFGGEDKQLLKHVTEGAPKTLPNTLRTNLNGANLSGANLTGANLTGADLTDANLTRANFTDADLSDTLLKGANFNQADLTNARLKNADIRGLGAGNQCEIISLQTKEYLVVYTSDDMAVGDLQLPLAEWFREDAAGKMDNNMQKWWEKHKSLLQKIIEANPAKPTK